MREWNVFQRILLLSLIFLMPGCSSDETVFSSPSEQGGEGIVTFTLPFIQKGAVSYATIAEDSENALSDLSIYMFNNESKKLEKVFRTSKSEITLEGSGANQTAKINVTGKTGTKIFYFVGNGEGRSDELANLNVGATLESDFIEAITDKHADPLATPLLMSGKTTITEVATPGNVPLELEVKLFRRVVRLDIDNDPKESNFDVKKILVSNAKLRGYVFGSATASPAKTIEEANYDPIEISTKTPGTPERLDSVFYLYPTTIGIGTDKTRIALEGIFNGETKVYNLNIADLQIIANKRYILKVKKIDLNKIDAAITVVEWEEGGEQTANPETDLVTFSVIDHSAVPGIVDKGDDTYDLTGVTAAGKLTFKTTSFNAKGTKAEVKYNYGSEDTYSDLKINTPTPALTYSSASYVQEYEIDIPQISDTKKPLEMEITLRNQANLDQKKVITLYISRYGDTKLYPVTVGGINWAPVNVGVSGPDAKVTDHGLYYQWGRTYIGFTYESGINPTDVVAGPMEAEEAKSGNGMNKFIAAPNAPQDWLMPGQLTSWTDQLCPQGWRIPTQDEFKEISNLYITNYANSSRLSFRNARLEVIGDNGTDILYMPAAGLRHYNSGTSGRRGTHGYYWSSDVYSEQAANLSFTSSSFVVGAGGRSSCFSVRCVQE
ncbi:uncharacterized protein (TIGR02145 family) [Parabacteroides sp. PF5-5]|uniref:FISUMP domain-containing protein n=1 Tax=unclassified Parabacteroides TaxID=2649774 RepID=UPI002473E83E|nr:MULTISPECIES: FISUMP domain-containing protein [unclassified Parabacteroides]MDH6304367.1 uncharacterized protein (TIGR02145 family) [Parabacteroides sp. PH5-39]MDH6315480.1 uncharacterized protein (TIGR02145 family) [Parabacteroides sp. PF5-13]MDH6319026.1 uncharacterized protein (TIGR02145 family) [Parabacteroides sp. PH5-13]MDH6322756.1 uncharacterized protein (TIGR02145 family) [Parabacteroides sp. PH5-8]MDH6326672.1 uncharacterized protein (TIGR02145 family) [Parabacteroides sp. PH5-41